MARPSLGPNYGNTDRSTPARLLGGMPQADSQGAIGGSQLQIPAIQAVQQLVETFSTPGRGPTMGGPAQVPSPPGVPQAQNPILSPLPRPAELLGTQVQYNRTSEPVVQPSVVMQPTYAPYVDNITPMAKALSGFSTFFDKLNTYAQERDKQADAQAKKQGEEVAVELVRRGFNDFPEAIREIEKKVTAGDRDLEPLLTRMRMQDFRGPDYADQKMQELAMRRRMSSAPEILKNTSRLPDGRDRRLVKPDEPAFMNFMSGLLGLDKVRPDVAVRMGGEVYQLYGSMITEQTKFVADANDTLVRAAAANDVKGNVLQFASGNIDKEQLVYQLGMGLDALYDSSRPTLYTEQVKNYKSTLVSAVQAIEDPTARVRIAGLIADEVLPNIPTGPRLPNGTRARLIDVLDGELTSREFFREATKNVLDDRTLDQDIRSAGAADAADAAAAQLFTPEVMNDPGRLSQAIERIPQLAEQEYPNDVVSQNAFRDRALKTVNGKKAVYSEPLQEKTFVELKNQQAMNPNANLMELVPQYKALYDNGQLSASQYSQLAGNARTSAREDAQGSMQQVRQNAAAYKKRLDEMAMGPGGTLDYETEAKNNQLVAQYYQQQLDYVRNNPGKDVAGDLANMHKQALAPMIEEQKAERRKPINQSSGEVLGRYKITTNRGKPEDNKRLMFDAQNRVILPPNTTRQQVRGLLTDDRNALDSNTKRMLLRLKQLGVPASQYYLNQLKNMGDTVSPAMEQKLREMDDSNLLSSTGSGANREVAYAGTGRYSTMANNLINTIQQGALNLVAPPAYAGTRDNSPFTGSASIPGGTAKVNQLIKLAQGAGFRGNDAAVMAAIALAESGGNVKALNDNRSTGDLSYGLWQINMIDDLGPERRRSIGIKNNEALWNPSVNAKAASLVHQSQGFGAWSVYKSGAYKQYLPAAQRALRGASLSR